MLLRKSISNTKRFFERTIESVKSLFSCADYQKLPKSKTSPYNNPPGSSHPYVTVRAHHDVIDNNVQTITKFDDLDYLYADYTKRNNMKKTRSVAPLKKKKKKKKNDNRKESQVYGSCLVAEKLKEFEMIDKSNVEHLLDIEEVLHYYSRLTCPAYRDIVHKFLFDMYCEISTSK